MALVDKFLGDPDQGRKNRDGSLLFPSSGS